MKSPVFSLLIIALCGIRVSAMALSGPPLLRYDPCGLGVINFQKIATNQLWMASVNLGLYTNLTEADIEIEFLEPVRFAWVSQNSNLILQENSTNLRLKPLGKLPSMYTFYVHTNNTLPVVKRFALNNKTLCDDEERIRLTLDKSSIANTCGRRTLKFAELTTYNSEARDGEWPWHVAITIRDLVNPRSTHYQCGGSIISTTAVLTAGHCFTRNGSYTDINRVLVIAGAANITYLDAKNWPPEILQARKIVIHPSYTDPLATADLAIVKVDGFQYNEFVQPICLWGPRYDKSKLIGLYGTVVGFGQTEGGLYNQLLRSANSVVQSDETCIKFNPTVYGDLMNEFTFCAGFGPQSDFYFSDINPRNGDSGGGFILPVQEKDHKVHFYLKGVLSKCGMPAGATTCDPGFYVVYTDVAPHHSWIMHHM